MAKATGWPSIRADAVRAAWAQLGLLLQKFGHLSRRCLSFNPLRSQCMTDKPRWHAEITGKFVQFLSRDPAKPNSRLASRWKAEYHTLKDAKEAKRVREERGYPLWP